MPTLDFRALLKQEKEEARRRLREAPQRDVPAPQQEQQQQQQQDKGDGRAAASSAVVVEPLGFTSHGRPIDLRQHEVKGGPGGLYYIGDFLGPEEARRLLQLTRLEGGPDWVQVRGRQLRCFGGEPSSSYRPEPLPLWLSQLSQGLVTAGVFDQDQAPNHVLVNVYHPGEGILAHTDGPFYLPKVAIVSLGCAAVFHLRPRHRPEDLLPPPRQAPPASTSSSSSSSPTTSSSSQCWSLVLQPGSLLVFHEPVYSSWLHAIEPLHAEAVPTHVLNAKEAGVSPGDVVERRGVRTSLTIRRALGTRTAGSSTD